MTPNQSIFEAMLAGGIISKVDPRMNDAWEVVFKTQRLIPALNNSTSISEVRARLSEIIGRTIAESTTIFTPFNTNFGIHIDLGEHVFINHDCTFLDLGGITIEDNAQIGPKVSLITENHPIDPQKRKDLDLASIHIKQNV